MYYQIGCDKNLLPEKNPFTFGLGRGPYSVARNCFMKRDLAGTSLEYMTKFFDTYKDDRKFFTARIISAHEFTGENNWYIDPQVSKYLNMLDEKGHLEKTITMIYSDHGDHIDYLMWQTRSGYAELMNPPLFVMVPEKLDEKIGKNLEGNQQRLITHYEIFRSIIDYWGAKPHPKVRKGPSLFYDLVDVNRNCKTADVYEDCKCWPKNGTNVNDIE